MIFKGCKHDGVTTDRQNLGVVSCKWFRLDHCGKMYLKYQVDERTNCNWWWGRGGHEPWWSWWRRLERFWSSRTQLVDQHLGWQGELCNGQWCCQDEFWGDTPTYNWGHACAGEGELKARFDCEARYRTLEPWHDVNASDKGHRQGNDVWKGGIWL